MRALPFLALPLLALLLPAAAASPGGALGDALQPACASTLVCGAVAGAADEVDDACGGDDYLSRADESAALVVAFGCAYGEATVRAACHDAGIALRAATAVPRFLVPAFGWPALDC